VRLGSGRQAHGPEGWTELSAGRFVGVDPIFDHVGPYAHSEWWTRFSD